MIKPIPPGKPTAQLQEIVPEERAHMPAVVVEPITTATEISPLEEQTGNVAPVTEAVSNEAEQQSLWSSYLHIAGVALVRAAFRSGEHGFLVVQNMKGILLDAQIPPQHVHQPIDEFHESVWWCVMLLFLREVQAHSVGLIGQRCPRRASQGNPLAFSLHNTLTKNALR